MSNKRSNSFRQAILQGNRRLSSKALLEEKGLSLSQRLIRHVAYETLPREIDRKWYYDSYTCCPPPWFMITVTLLEARTGVELGGGRFLNLGLHGERFEGESCRSNSSRSASQSLAREPSCLAEVLLVSIPRRRLLEATCSKISIFLPRSKQQNNVTNSRIWGFSQTNSIKPIYVNSSPGRLEQ